MERLQPAEAAVKRRARPGERSPTGLRRHQQRRQEGSEAVASNLRRVDPDPRNLKTQPPLAQGSRAPGEHQPEQRDEPASVGRKVAPLRVDRRVDPRAECQLTAVGLPEGEPAPACRAAADDRERPGIAGTDREDAGTDQGAFRLWRCASRLHIRRLASLATRGRGRVDARRAPS